MKRRDFIAAGGARIRSRKQNLAELASLAVGQMIRPAIQVMLHGCGLREKGWIEGKNLLVEYRMQAGQATLGRAEDARAAGPALSGYPHPGDPMPALFSGPGPRPTPTPPC